MTWRLLSISPYVKGGKSVAGKSAKTGRRSAWNEEEMFSEDEDGQTQNGGRGGKSTVGRD
jgi:ribosomal RNA-processing protein 12